MLLFEGFKPLRAMVTELNKTSGYASFFSFFFLLGQKKHRYYWKPKLREIECCLVPCSSEGIGRKF